MKVSIPIIGFTIVLIAGLVTACYGLFSVLGKNAHSLIKYNEKISEEILVKSLFFYDDFVNFYKGLNFHLFNDGTIGVIIGKKDWLFTDEEWHYNRNTSTDFYRNLAFIKKTSEQFKSMGIKLLILPVPLKASIYREYLKYPIPISIEQKYDELKKFLFKNSIIFCDLYPAFYKNKNNNIFFKKDTHWTPNGSYLAAVEIKKCLGTNGNWKKQFLKRDIDDILSNEGDLTKYLPKVDTTIMPQELFQSYIYTNMDIAPQNDLLFSDADTDVTLIGTSYSANPRWDFLNALKYTLAARIFNFSQEASGPFQNMMLYLESLKMKKKNPAVIIWEIPQRYLLSPIEKTPLL